MHTPRQRQAIRKFNTLQEKQEALIDRASKVMDRIPSGTYTPELDELLKEIHDVGELMSKQFRIVHPDYPREQIDMQHPPIEA